jgi:hypothetical protein
MFGFLKRRKEAKAMAEIGRAYVGTVGDEVATDLNKFFDAIGQADDELIELAKARFAGVGLAEGLSPKQEAEIELQAAMDQWNETRVNLREQGEQFLANVFQIASAVDASAQMREVVDKRWADADLNFKAKMVIAFGEATEGLSETPNPSFNVETASLAAIVTRILNNPRGTQIDARELIQYYRRLVDIAWFDNHVTDEERDTAEKAATAMKADILKSFEDNPAASKAFIEASDCQMENLLFYGRGSLTWLAEEQGITAAQHVDFIVQPEFAHLVPAHLTMLSDETMATTRYPVMKALIAARRSSPDQSDAHSLYALHQKGDRSIEILLKADELKVLKATVQDYPAVEAMVARIMSS